MIASSAFVARAAAAQGPGAPITTPDAPMTPPASPSPATATATRPPQLDHKHQLALAVLPGIGYRVIARYNERQTCIDSSEIDRKWVCTNDVPFFVDFQVAFGVTSKIDLLTDVRLGVARDDAVGIGRQFAIAPGVRVWLDDDVRLKFFTTLQGVIDHTAQNSASVEDTDFGVRNANGLMFDAIRNVGFYFQFGETIGFRRWFRIELDVGLGVQVRFP
jgi:hypothetical protein